MRIFFRSNFRRLMVKVWVLKFIYSRRGFINVGKV